MTRWRWFDKLGVVVLALFALWLAVPSSLFLRPLSMSVAQEPDGRWVMTSVRQLPFGRVNAKWSAVYRVLGREDGITCVGEGTVPYEPVAGDLVRYYVRPWGEPCLAEGPPISITYSRQVLFLGIVPLRPVRYSFTINPDAAPIIEGGE